MKKDDDRSISTRSTYVITFLLGLAFSITLMQSTWKTAVERKQKDFHFEILSIQQAVASNVLTGNDVTNNVAAFMTSHKEVETNQFESFTNDILERYEHIEAVNYYSFAGDDWVNEFRLKYKSARGENRIGIGEDIYSDPKYIDAIDTSISTSSVVPAPPDLERDPDRKYWLFKAIYSQDSHSSIKKKQYAGTIKGMVSVLVSPTKLLGDKGANSNLTITMFSDTSNLYGRQLLYFNGPTQKENDKRWKVETLVEEKLIQLPPYSIKIIIEKNLYFSDLEYHLLLVATLICVGILMMLFGLVSARIKQEEELKTRNTLIEQKVEEQTKELAIARDEALESVRMKSEFLASMSHEIRTPLNAIIGMSDLMSETNLDNEQSRYVSVFQKAGDALLSLVNDILDLSKMEAQQLVLENIPFNIISVIEESAEIYALQAADKDIEIITRTHLNHNINSSRIGDPGRLQQIILNLISNALKFTDAGEITITLSDGSEKNKDEDSETDNIIISVSDTGIGIPKEKLETIFSSFTQADTSTTRKYGGTGLGLTICKHLSQMMGGNISVESEEGKGSCFSVLITLAKQADQSLIKHNFINKNIYVIDTSANSCLSIEEHINETGANAIKITNVDEIENAINSGPEVDVMLINSQFVFSGEEIKESILKHVNLNKVVLLLNPKHMSRHSRTAESHGLIKLLIKPVKCKELYFALDAVINLRSDGRSNVENKYEKYSNVSGKRILLVEDNPDNRLLIKAYLKNTPHSVDEAENGSIAVDMCKQTDYDIIFMDVQMPVMDGHEATRLIRSWEKEQNKARTKIISLTAHAIREEVEKCLAAGCDSHLSKPIKKATLLSTIKEMS